MAQLNPQIPRPRIYTDLDLSFNKVPVTGDVAINVGDLAVIRSVENLVQTGYYERPFQPLLGSSVRQLLFENATPLTTVALNKAIAEVITNYEPRVSLVSVNVQSLPDQDTLAATVTFYINNNTQPTTISVFLQRIR